jgi:hypothetical protein
LSILDPLRYPFTSSPYSLLRMYSCKLMIDRTSGNSNSELPPRTQPWELPITFNGVCGPHVWGPQTSIDPTALCGCVLITSVVCTAVSLHYIQNCRVCMANVTDIVHNLCPISTKNDVCEIMFESSVLLYTLSHQSHQVYTDAKTKRWLQRGYQNGRL